LRVHRGSSCFACGGLGIAKAGGPDIRVQTPIKDGDVPTGCGDEFTARFRAAPE
jgi:hypothetical protein